MMNYEVTLSLLFAPGLPAEAGDYATLDCFVREGVGHCLSRPRQCAVAIAATRLNTSSNLFNRETGAGGGT